MWSALRSRDFRLLWLSQSTSVFGDMMVVVAIGLFVTRLTHHPRDVGIVLSGYAIPLVVFVLIGGVIADRLPRQRVMIASDSVRCVLHGILAALIATHSVRIWEMTLIGVLFGTAEAFFQPAYSGLIPQTVEETDIQSAQALGGLSRELSTFAGPAVATALVLGANASSVFAADAGTFALSALVLSRLRPRARGETATTPGINTGVEGDAGASMLRELSEGWRAVRERTWVWATIAAFSVALLAALAPFFVLGADVGHRVYGSEAVYGIANVTWGVGTVSGVVIGGRWRPARPMFAGVIAATLWPGAMAVFAAGPPRGVTYAVMTVAGVGIGLFTVWWETALAQRIPPQLLSRVSAWDWMGSMALLPVGYLISGPIAAAVGPTKVMVVGGCVATAAMLLAWLPKSTRGLRRLDDGEPPAVAQPWPAPAVATRSSSAADANAG